MRTHPHAHTRPGNVPVTRTPRPCARPLSAPRPLKRTCPRTRAHTHAHARPGHAHAHTCTLMRTHTHAHAHSGYTLYTDGATLRRHPSFRRAPPSALSIPSPRSPTAPFVHPPRCAALRRRALQPAQAPGHNVIAPRSHPTAGAAGLRAPVHAVDPPPRRSPWPLHTARASSPAPPLHRPPVARPRGRT